MKQSLNLITLPRRTQTAAHILCISLSALAAAPGLAEAQLANGIPNLCTNPTIASVRSGSWSDPATWSIGQVPTVNDRVAVSAGTTVTYDRQSDADLTCVNVHGQLTFRTDVSTRLTVGTLTIMPGAGLQIGTSGAPVAANAVAEIVIADRPVDTGTDPEQYGTGLLGFGRITMHGSVKSPTFVRLSAEANAGQSSLALAAGVAGWQGGDRLVLPGTNQSSQSPASYVGQWETPTLAAASGSGLALAGGLAFPHGGGRNVAGALVFLPHVGNITRNIVIRSQNPQGTRGHVLMTDRAEVDIRYTAFKDLGRTTISPLDSTVMSSGHATHIGTNQIGRYSLHLHHLFGPASPLSNSYQFIVIGNAIDGGTKWGITIHDTHYGLVQDNVVYNAAGAGIMTEDGSETANVIQNNFVVRAWGTGLERADGRQGINDWGWEGSGIWLRGPDNIIRNNVVANANSFAVTYMMLGVGSVRVPSTPGADPNVSGHTVNMMAVPLREFSANEFYGVHRGITVWNLGANCCTEVYDVPVSTFLNTRMWNVGVLGFYGYGENRVTFDGWVHYNDPSMLTNPHENAVSFFFGDYIARNIVIRQADIQGLRIGIQAPIKAGDTSDIYGNTPGTLTVENSTLKNYWNVYMNTPYGVTGGGSAIPPRLVVARNVQFSNVPGVSGTQGQAHVFRHFTPNQGTNQNIIVSDRMVVESFNGNANDNFEVFANEQAPTFVIPSTPLTTSVAGLTNAQARSVAGISISGAITPCSTTRTGIVGFTCPAGSLPALPPAPTSPPPSATPPPPPPSASAPPPSNGSPPPPPNSCTTPDPFAAMGGGTCVNGGWLPPGMSAGPITPAPTPVIPAPIPAPPGNGTTGCTTPDPYVSLGGGTCANGGWLPPTTPPPAPVPPPSASVPAPSTAATITLNPSVRYQTMTGWEAGVLSSIGDYTSISDSQWAALLELAVNELGINRVRLEISSGVEGPGNGSGYNIVNDNADPNVINAAGFNFTTVDWRIDHIIQPWRQRVIARGETPYINLLYVDFGASAFEHHQNPQEYAEFMLATFQHLNAKYGFVPNGIEVMLAPNDVSGWSPDKLGAVIVATAARLQAAGFAVPDFIGPSTSNMGAAPSFIDGILAVPGAAPLIKEFSYHRYGGTLSDLQQIASRAVQQGKRTSMLEYLG